MRILREYPPNFDEIVAALPEARTPGAIFSYGDTIYNPGAVRIWAPLRAHEAVHSARQGKTDAEIRAWWNRYATDPSFRLDEEVPAHRAEYAEFCRLEKDKEKRFRFLVGLANRLSGPLYGDLIPFRAAKEAIRDRPERMEAAA